MKSLVSNAYQWRRYHCAQQDIFSLPQLKCDPFLYVPDKAGVAAEGPVLILDWLIRILKWWTRRQIFLEESSWCHAIHDGGGEVLDDAVHGVVLRGGLEIFLKRLNNVGK